MWDVRLAYVDSGHSRRCDGGSKASAIARAGGPPEFRVVHPTKKGSSFDCPLFPA